MGREATWVSVQQAADVLGVSRQRVHVFIKRGDLIPRPIGRAFMLNLRDVLALHGKRVIDGITQTHHEEGVQS